MGVVCGEGAGLNGVAGWVGGHGDKCGVVRRGDGLGDMGERLGDMGGGVGDTGNGGKGGEETETEWGEERGSGGNTRRGNGGKGEGETERWGNRERKWSSGGGREK